MNVENQIEFQFSCTVLCIQKQVAVAVGSGRKPEKIDCHCFCQEPLFFKRSLEKDVGAYEVTPAIVLLILLTRAD